tara:strand:- start:429 stop:617 length:189 start_codon:yes stop_codon:yes gene_type:complete
MAFNCAINNYKKLWGELNGLKDEKCNSDTRALIESISQWNTLKTWERINGMFAISVLDKNSF